MRQWWSSIVFLQAQITLDVILCIRYGYDHEYDSLHILKNLERGNYHFNVFGLVCLDLRRTNSIYIARLYDPETEKMILAYLGCYKLKNNTSCQNRLTWRMNSIFSNRFCRLDHAGINDGCSSYDSTIKGNSFTTRGLKCFSFNVLLVVIISKICYETVQFREISIIKHLRQCKLALYVKL
jgi:hypothetical protein